ncbi:helix-turn-helix transcriptional regulator [Ochrobactrum oryzae]|nr:helix-turn-helix transcriptional regulator [Brucella oryzae]NKC23242.1 helix-turn-helix transcriptional regulator [Brucella oryzae]
MKRGALYHHFRDKADLFEAVCRDLAGEAAEAVTAATEALTDPVEMLEKGRLPGSTIWDSRRTGVFSLSMHLACSGANDGKCLIAIFPSIFCELVWYKQLKSMRSDFPLVPMFSLYCSMG